MAWRRGKAYSQDLRDRVLAASAEGLSSREVAEQFDVSPSYVIKAVQRLNREGERSARPQCSHTPRKLSEAQHAAVRARVLEQPDATMTELRAWVLREHGVAVSHAGIWTTLVRLGLTLKKTAARRRTGPRRRGQGSRRLGGRASATRSRQTGVLGRDRDDDQHGTAVRAWTPR
jgi:transposase